MVLIVRDECPAFSVSEWSAICDALHGTRLVAEHTDADPARHLWAELADSPELASKWGIDQAALVERLRGLTYAQRCAVVEVANRFWRAPQTDTPPEALGAAGARLR